MTSEVGIRRARMSDYSAVVDGIGDVYWGRDYLPALYTGFLQDPDCFSFVAEVDGKVVGFYAGELVDNKQTLYKMAGRVKDEYKGQGIITKLSDAIDTEAAKLGTAKREVMACLKETAERLSKGYTQKKGFELIVHVVRQLLKLIILCSTLH
ncbi:histidine N-acetyltransferase [Aplysia californica]|uniref:Histidine N-acetyltransferase n=1 Tax=Aplysia californica TaxID=6500 RepID=A0ABM1VUK7_APLCA|nr:histidine N-acetyltransferase [Aplysia californica]